MNVWGHKKKRQNLSFFLRYMTFSIPENQQHIFSININEQDEILTCNYTINQKEYTLINSSNSK